MPRDVKHESLDPREAEAKRLREEADREALERLYGPKSKQKEAKGQWGVGIALLVLGPIMMAVGAAMGGEVGLVAVGAIASGVGIWALVDGLVRADRAKREARDRDG